MKGIRAISACRACGNQALIPIISLGKHCVTNFVSDASEPSLRVPLELVLCDPKQGGCGLLQLRHTTPAELLYSQHYWYRSGINQTMHDELADIARKAVEIARLRPGDMVLDIGCNDGTLLRAYPVPDLRLVGVDPATNLIPFAREGTTKIINDFFSHEAVRSDLGHEKARVITAISMFYDLDDPNVFLADVTKCLAPDGLFIIQQNYLVGMLNQIAFDNICHEHLEYYSLFSMENLLKRHGLQVIDVEERVTNGGSFRTYIRPVGSPVPDAGKMRTQAMREREARLGLHDRQIYETFASRVNQIASHLRSFIEKEASKGKTIYAYGASTRGNTTLQFCKLDHRVIKAAAERNPDKWGKKTVGTLIPIISEEQARADNPDYFLILPWHFLHEFLQREADFLQRGGKFIVPLPEFKVIPEPLP